MNRTCGPSDGPASDIIRHVSATSWGTDDIMACIMWRSGFPEPLVTSKGRAYIILRLGTLYLNGAPRPPPPPTYKGEIKRAFGNHTQKSTRMIIFAKLRCCCCCSSSSSCSSLRARWLVVQVHAATNRHGINYCRSKSSVERIYFVLRLFNMTRLVTGGKYRIIRNVVFSLVERLGLKCYTISVFQGNDLFQCTLLFCSQNEDT